jgi:hypothetical protein
MNPATGPKSVSFKASAGGFLTGIGTILSGLIHNPTSMTNAQSAVSSTKLWVGGIITLGSILGKLFHDHGFNKATIMTAGSDLARALPEIRHDLAKTVGFVENDIPQINTLVASFDNRLKSIETSATNTVGVSPADIESAIRRVFGTAPAATTTTVTATPPTTTTTPPTA